MSPITICLFCVLYFLLIISLYLSINTRSEEFELLGTKYGKKVKKSRKIVHTLWCLVSIFCFLGYFGGFILYLIYYWNLLDKHFWYIVALIFSFIVYIGVFNSIDERFLQKRDVRFNNEITNILSNNAVYQAIINKTKTNRFQSICIASDGVAFFCDRISSIKYPEIEVEDHWMQSYKEKYIDLGKNSIIAATKRRCREWEHTTKEMYNSVHNFGCNDFILFTDYGYDGITSASNSDIRRYLCKDLDFNEEIVTIDQPFFSYYYESYGGNGTINGSVINYTPSGCVREKTTYTGHYTYTVLNAKSDNQLNNVEKTMATNEKLL